MTSEELKTTTALADLILPKDANGPAASEVGVPEFINEWVSAPYEKQRNDSEIIRGGLACLNTESFKRYQKRFDELTEAEQSNIVDDICDTAGTLCKAAETLIEAGATEVHSYITHGVLSGPAVERVQNSVMKSLVITDSIEQGAKVKGAKNIRIVPTAPMFAQAILNIWGGMSVSSLFETDTLVPIYEGLYQRS